MSSIRVRLFGATLCLCLISCGTDPANAPIPVGGPTGQPPQPGRPQAQHGAPGTRPPTGIPPTGTPQPGTPQPGTPQAGTPQPGMPRPTPPAGSAAVQQIPGYVYIPPGTVLVGTPKGETPRCAKNEMVETPVALNGFYIMQYPVPGIGKPPTAGATWDQAKAACESVNARLCTEIEWERACKGPDNSEYPYNTDWNPAVCAVKDKSDYMPPLGTFAGCVTEEGVHDMVGYLWEWTSSTWGIPGKDHNDLVLRGGWKGFGRIPNRCAHRYHAAHDKESKRLGYRCCYGPVNTPVVSVPQTEGELFESVKLMDRGFEELLRDFRPRANRGQKFKNIRRMKDNDTQTVWRPTPNVKIIVVKLEYDKRDGSRGGSLLVFSEERDDHTQSILAVFDRPERDDDEVKFYAKGNKKSKEMEVAVVWKDRNINRVRRLLSKATYDCGMIKLIPKKWISPGEGDVPKSVPHLKIVLDMTTGTL